MKPFQTLTVKEQFVLREVCQCKSLVDFKLNFELLDAYKRLFQEPDRGYHGVYRTILKIANDLVASKVLKKQTIWMCAEATRRGKALTTSQFVLHRKWRSENRENVTRLKGGKNLI